MKRVLSALVVSALMASSALAASVSYTNTQSFTSLGTALSLSKFDTSLGTLTGVTVTIDFSTPQGSFTVQNNAPNSVSVRNLTDSLYVDGTGFGYSFTGNTKNITANPSVSFPPGYSLPESQQQIFSVVSSQTLLDGGTPVTNSIASGFWSAYEGAGSFSFTGYSLPSITVVGGAYSADTTLVTANTSMSVTYTYDAGPAPVPEPSTVMAGGLLVLIGAGTYLRRRRKSAGA